MPFTGYNEHVIDEKHRLSIPKSLRKQLDPERNTNRFYLVPGVVPGSLRLFPEYEFKTWSEGLEAGLIVSSRQAQLKRQLFTLAELVEMDSAGRIVMPVRHLKEAGIGRDVAVNGVHDHIEVIDRDKFNEQRDTMWPSYIELQSQLAEELNRRTDAGGLAETSRD